MKDLPKPCPSIGAIPTSYLESLSYYEQILWLCKYLQTVVIPAINQNAQAVTQLRNMFIQLKDYYDALENHVNETEKILVNYINNTIQSIVNFINQSNNDIADFLNQTIKDLKQYIDDQFTDLNVQDEINNKLDQMVEDGTLAQIINQGVLNNKLSRFIIEPNMTQQQIQSFLDYPFSKILDFQNGEYTFNEPLSINSNTIILLNNAIINSNIGYTFTNFKRADEFTQYNGNYNISIIGGKLNGAGICFCHGKNIKIINTTFEKCSADHFIQIAATNGVLLKNCNFDGVPTSVPWFREYVQIDNMDYNGFPFFEENNPTFDNTTNKNWIVDACQFTNNISKNDENYTMCVGIGNHASNSIDERLHENIIIKNCLFDGTTSSSIRTISMRNLKIDNCIFKTDSPITESPKPQIYMWYRIENAIISNNTIENNLYAIIIETPKFLNNILINNNIIQNYNNFSTPNNFIIKADGCGNLKIKNNQFLNNTQIHIKVTSYSFKDNINSNHSFEISNNLFHTESTSKDVLQIGEGNPIILNNIFEIPDDSYNISLQNSTKIIKPFIRGNLLNVNKYYKEKKLDCKNIYDLPFNLYFGQLLDNTIITPDYKITDFRNLTLMLGYVNNIQEIKLSPYIDNGFGLSSENEVYSFFVGKNNPVGDNSPVLVTLTIYQNGNFQYDAKNSNLPLRRIIGYN